MALDTVLPGQTVAGEGKSGKRQKLEAGSMMGRFLYDMVNQIDKCCALWGIAPHNRISVTPRTPSGLPDPVRSPPLGWGEGEDSRAGLGSLSCPASLESSQHKDPDMPSLASIHLYPIKSTAGMPLTRALVTQEGLLGIAATWWSSRTAASSQPAPIPSCNW